MQSSYRSSTDHHRVASGRSPRHGAALLVVVIAVVVSTMVTAVLAQAALRQRRQLQHERDRLQAFWLLESGVQRAAAQLAHNAAYAGERWSPEAPGPAGPQPAAVTIRVHAIAAADGVLIAVTSEFPAGAVHRTRLHRELTIPNRAPRPTGASASALSPENVVP